MANTGPTEKRKSVRYLTPGKVCFQWQGSDGQWNGAVGVTRNIGKAGVFVESESIPSVASTLKLVVVLPTGWETDWILCLRGSGHVRHVWREPNRPSGFGAVANFHVEVPMAEK